MRLVTFNIASVDGRIALSPSTPSWLDPRWQPLDRFETVDALSLHGARVSLQGSNSFTGRDAPEASFLGALGSIRDLDLISAETRPDASIFVRYAVR